MTIFWPTMKRESGLHKSAAIGAMSLNSGDSLLNSCARAILLYAAITTLGQVMRVTPRYRASRNDELGKLSPEFPINGL